MVMKTLVPCCVLLSLKGEGGEGEGGEGGREGGRRGCGGGGYVTSFPYTGGRVV